MVKTEAQVRDIISQYIKYLSEQIRVNKVILYGSYAEGTATAESDIDIAIVSPDFGDNFVEDCHKLSRSVWRSGVEPSLEPRPLYSSMDPSLLGEITTKGKVVFDSNLAN